MSLHRGCYCHKPAAGKLACHSAPKDPGHSFAVWTRRP